MTGQSLYKSLLGQEWVKLLSDYLLTKDLERIGGYISKQRGSGVSIIPPAGNNITFRVFNMLPPERVKVIILGQEPYSQDNPIVATGIAFDSTNIHAPDSAVRNIINEIIREYPQKITLDRGDLSYLVKQGVFLSNTALTVVANRPNSHQALWKNFTIGWIKALQNTRDKVWLLMGKEAQAYSVHINNPSHYVIKVSHPDQQTVSKALPIPFENSDCFKIINRELLARNINAINW